MLLFDVLTQSVAAMTAVVVVPMGRWRSTVTEVVTVQVATVPTGRWRSTVTEVVTVGRRHSHGPLAIKRDRSTAIGGSRRLFSLFNFINFTIYNGEFLNNQKKVCTVIQNVA